VRSFNEDGEDEEFHTGGNESCIVNDSSKEEEFD
jgi:hypothetical protein